MTSAWTYDKRVRPVISLTTRRPLRLWRAANQDIGQAFRDVKLAGKKTHFVAPAV